MTEELYAKWLGVINNTSAAGKQVRVKYSGWEIRKQILNNKERGNRD